VRAEAGAERRQAVDLQLVHGRRAACVEHVFQAGGEELPVRQCGEHVVEQLVVELVTQQGQLGDHLVALRFAVHTFLLRPLHGHEQRPVEALLLLHRGPSHGVGVAARHSAECPRDPPTQPTDPP
jgi:hypothetical protein